MTKVWAHRGASAYAPENTIPAFQMAMEMGADGLELDVHESSDGKLMVIHDERIDRTSNGTGRVVDMTCQQLKKLVCCFVFLRSWHFLDLPEILRFLICLIRL